MKCEVFLPWPPPSSAHPGLCPSSSSLHSQQHTGRRESRVRVEQSHRPSPAQLEEPGCSWKPSAAASLPQQHVSQGWTRLQTDQQASRSAGRTEGQPSGRGGSRLSYLEADETVSHVEEGYANNLPLSGQSAPACCHGSAVCCQWTHATVRRHSWTMAERRKPARTHPFTHGGHPDVPGLD